MAPTRDQYLRAITTDAEAIAGAVTGRLDAAIPTCPEWNAADLAWHIAGVHHFWGSIADGKVQDRETVVRQDRPTDDEALPALVRANAARLVDILAGADDTTPVYSWSQNKTIGFIPRRMAQETMVHRYDASLAIGTASSFDAAFADDGVDEILRVFLPSQDGTPDFRGVLAFATTDTNGAWTVTAVDDGVKSARAASDAPIARVTATANDLLLGLWNRVPLNSLPVEGDASVVRAFLAWVED